MRPEKIIFLFLLLASGALATVSAKASSLPSSMVDGTSGFAVEALGSSCFAFDVPADILPCNPGFIAKKRPHHLKAEVFLGNNISYLQEASDLINGDASGSTLQKLFTQKQSSQLETSLDAGYLGETFGVQITPFHLNYYSLFQNPSLPEVTLFGSVDESARMQVGSYLGDDFYWGLQLRYLHRKFISNQFFVTDVLTDNRGDIFTPREQNTIYLEPSLLYSPDGVKWHPEISAMIADLGATDSTVDTVAIVPQYHLTGSLNPDLGAGGKISFGLDLMWTREEQDAGNFATLGTSYQYGILRLMGSLGVYAQGIGFTVSDDFWNIGLSYSIRKFTDPFSDTVNEHKVYMLFGAQI